jgi:hypothetical protein
VQPAANLVPMSKSQMWTGRVLSTVGVFFLIFDGTLSHILFPTYVASLLWLGLYLRDPALCAFVPMRKAS